MKKPKTASVTYLQTYPHYPHLHLIHRAHTLLSTKKFLVMRKMQNATSLLRKTALSDTSHTGRGTVLRPSFPLIPILLLLIYKVTRKREDFRPKEKVTVFACMQARTLPFYVCDSFASKLIVPCLAHTGP